MVQAGIIVLFGIRDASAVVSSRFGVFGSLIDSFNDCADSLLCLSGQKTTTLNQSNSQKSMYNVSGSALFLNN